MCVSRAAHAAREQRRQPKTALLDIPTNHEGRLEGLSPAVNCSVRTNNVKGLSAIRSWSNILQQYFLSRRLVTFSVHNACRFGRT